MIYIELFCTIIQDYNDMNSIFGQQF